MKNVSYSEQQLIEDLSHISMALKKASKGLSIGAILKSIRIQLGMSQRALALRASVPQSTISRIEQGVRDMNVSTLQKVCSALSCDLVFAPILEDSIEVIRKKQARKVAQKQISYLQGTMNLEEQQPDKRFTERLLRDEEIRLLREGKALWEEYG